MIFIDSPSSQKRCSGGRANCLILGSRTVPAVFAAFLGILVCLAPNAAAAETGNALPLAGVQFPLTDTSREIRENLTVLSDSDARLYREIFRLQEGGEWKAADKRVKKLSDRL